MEQRDGQLLRTAGLNFFGTVMAGQSHEVTNVLNIINELAGLQADMLRSAELGYPLDTVRLKQVTERIRNQVVRGETIVRSMNRFAHSVDCPVTVFDLKEALGQITYLAQRPANLSKTILDQEFPEESIPLDTSPFGLKQAVFNCIEVALAASSETRRVTVSYRIDDDGAIIEINSADPILRRENATEEEGILTLLMRQLGGQLRGTPSEVDPHRFLLFFPRPATASSVGTQGT